MKKVVLSLLVVSLLTLCGLSVAQWLREAKLRRAIDGLHLQLDDEHKLRVEAEKNVAALEQENARITQLRADTEAKLLELTETFRLTQEDQLQRGTSIILLTNEVLRARERVATLDLALAKARTMLEEQSSRAGDGNDVIKEANAKLKQVTAERDDAIRKANERTKAFNELAEKYNKLVR